MILNMYRSSCNVIATIGQQNAVIWGQIGAKIIARKALWSQRAAGFSWSANILDHTTSLLSQHFLFVIPCVSQQVLLKLWNNFAYLRDMLLFTIWLIVMFSFFTIHVCNGRSKLTTNIISYNIILVLAFYLSKTKLN